MKVQGHKVEYPENIQTPKDVEKWFLRQVTPGSWDKSRSVLIQVGDFLRKGDPICDLIEKLSVEVALTIHNFLSLYGTKDVGALFTRPECTAWSDPEQENVLVVSMRFRISAPEPEQVDIAA